MRKNAFDRFRRLISVEAAVFNSELLCHRVGQFFHIIRHFSKSPDHRPKYPAALAVGAELRFKTIARIIYPCIQRFGPGMIVRVDLFLKVLCHICILAPCGGGCAKNPDKSEELPGVN